MSNSLSKLKQPPRTALDVFNMLPEGTLAEIIDNALYISRPNEFPMHDIAMHLGHHIYRYVESKKFGDCVMRPLDIHLDNKNILQPDIIFISNANKGIIINHQVRGAPDLLVEIIADTKTINPKKKTRIYQKFGVKEYFIVAPATKETFTYYHDGKKYIAQESKKGKIKSKLLKKTFSF